jgi:hypothetical protein
MVKMERKRLTVEKEEQKAECRKIVPPRNGRCTIMTNGKPKKSASLPSSCT